jgi:hypothetical protein
VGDSSTLFTGWDTAIDYSTAAVAPAPVNTLVIARPCTVQNIFVLGAAIKYINDNNMFG